MHDIDLIILVCAGLTVISVLTSLVAFRVGAPLLLLFLCVGLIAGEDGPGGIIFNDAPAAYLIGSAALAVILFDSGFHTKISSYRHAAAPAIVLATIGVVATVAIVAAAGHYLIKMSWGESLLIGTVLSSTDAAALFFLLRVGGITIRDRVRSTLEVESGTNDPLAIFLTLTLVSVITGTGSSDWLELVARLIWQAGGGVLFGLAGGLMIVAIVNRLRLEPGLVPVVVLAFAIVLLALTNEVGASGFLATYIAGLIAGNAKLQSVGTLRRFQDGVTWLAQIVMFVTLGLLATPHQFSTIWSLAVVLAVVLIVVARPIAVVLCLLPFRFSMRERIFIGWVGLRGAVSILLALVPVIGNVAGAPVLFDIAFVVVVISLIVQGWTVRPMARGLGLIVPGATLPVHRTEIDLPGMDDHEIVVYPLPEGSAIAQGKELPRWARPVLVRRDNQVITAPRQFMPGDQVYFLATPQQVPLLDKLLAGTPDENEAEATFYGDFAIEASATLKALHDAYDLPLQGGDEQATLAQLFEREFGTDLELGDRLHLGPVDLIIRDIRDGQIVWVGIALEPAPPKGFWPSVRRTIAEMIGAR
ncbi:MAG TPA: potassium/proton antiporter [Magnetospirillaceae bacterium]|jgi:cell volume regulation protein A